MKKICIVLLILSLAAPALARRTDMMSSYGYGKKSSQHYTGSRLKKTKRPSHAYYRESSMYNKSTGYRCMSKAARMLYEQEHYNDYVDRNRYLKELRALDLEKRRRELEKLQ